MKVAICFSGQVRELEKSSDYWKKIIDRYQADVYGSFWTHSSPPLSEDFFDNSVENKDFIDKFSPKGVEFEDFKSFKKTIDQFKEEISVPTYPPQAEDFEYASIRPWVRSVNFGVANSTPDYINSAPYLSMWYKIWRANFLSSGQEYDVVIRARTDVFLDDNFKIFRNDYLNIPWGFIGNNSWKNCWGYIDLFAYGSQKIMDYYSSLFFYLSRYLKEGAYLFPAENILRTHLSQREIKIRLMNNKIFRFRDPEFSFNGSIDNSLEEQIRNSVDDFLEPDPLFSFFRE